ncbi:MAG: 2-oxo acid dehydrogenase subunit E2 [Chitinophagales bacterium]|nr:2-oxo acid dehydrogenase subunit E2 [Chitinophagales bacterium]MDW8427371.1 dihydrolipoamide acetyltransferase family protein [Chitinophagales bacterium]
MAEVELIMPKMGESIMEATILKWLKKEGDPVRVDEPVVEIATDKVDSEVPSPYAGVITKILYKVNDVVPVGKPIAIIATTEEKEVAPTVEVPFVPQATPEPKSEIKPATVSAPPAGNGGRFYSPLVLNIARSEGISMAELEHIPGTGEGGRVTKKDILNYIKNKNASAPQEAPAVSAAPVVREEPTLLPPAPEQSTGEPSEQVEIIEMDRVRRLIAEHMVHSKRTAPHVTSFVEADVTNLVLWREKVKEAFETREGEKLTFTPLFIEAIVKAIKDFPLINASVDGTRIIRKKEINIGMATALPNGNLIVPVIKHADQLNLVGLTREVNDLARRARAQQLKPHEIEGGTFTLTNVGIFGNLMGTPIINQPQVAILATGAIRKRPAVLETPQGDVIAIRHMMFLSLSYDHRIIDGALGGSFLRRVADYLENFDVNRTI